MGFYLDIDDETAAAVLDSKVTGITRDMKHASTCIENAGLLLKMTAPDKADQLSRLTWPPRQPYPPRLSRELVKRLIGLLACVKPSAVGTIMDKNYHVFPDKIKYVNEHAPGLAHCETDTLFVLDKITEIEWLQSYLEVSLELDVDVVND